MGLDRIANFNSAHGDRNPRHPPCLSREIFIACYNVINLISLNKGETANSEVTSSNSVATSQPSCAGPTSAAPRPSAAAAAQGTGEGASGAGIGHGRGRREGNAPLCPAPAARSCGRTLLGSGGPGGGRSPRLLPGLPRAQVQPRASVEGGTRGSRGVRGVEGTEACGLCSQRRRSRGRRCPSGPRESALNCGHACSHEEKTRSCRPTLERCLSSCSAGVAQPRSSG